ncbi:MAG: hypothetical protein ACE5JJ_09685 [Nitrospinota bacterium]
MVQGIRTHGGSINDVIAGILPFAAAMLVMVVLLMYFPALAMWLPSRLFE